MKVELQFNKQTDEQTEKSITFLEFVVEKKLLSQGGKASRDADLSPIATRMQLLYEFLRASSKNTHWKHPRTVESSTRAKRKQSFWYAPKVCTTFLYEKDSQEKLLNQNLMGMGQGENVTMARLPLN